MAPSNNIDNFRELLRSSQTIIAIAGAGLSAASGIPTFRGAGGMWRKYDAMSLATPEGFRESPSLVWQFYHYRREKALRAQPNNAHRALSALSLPDVRQQIAPQSTSFTLVTQNVDGLSRRANEEIAAMFGQAEHVDDMPIIEMHGRLFDVRCTKVPDHVVFNTDSPVCEALEGTEKMVDKGIIDPIIDKKYLPHCTKCGSLARPGVVWFGEIPPHGGQIDRLVNQTDLCLVIGTSSTVYPAAGYAEEVRLRGGKVAVFNLERSSGDDEADYLFLGPCEETLVEVLGLTFANDGKMSVKGP